jgi:diguanylate cyclase (GGDEF)-like protein
MRSPAHSNAVAPNDADSRTTGSTVSTAPMAPQGHELVEATLRTARRTVAFALLSMVVVLALIAAQRTWSDRMRDHATERVLQAERIAGAILLADERLSMSAYLAAATGEERWIARYHRHLPDIEAGLAAGQQLAPTEVARHFHDQTRTASESLVSLETTALEAVREPAVARSILDGERYRRDKALLTSSMHEFTASTLQAMRDELASSRQRNDLMLAATLLLALTAGALTWQRLRNSLAKSRDALVEAQSRIQHMATIDTLTGWPNRTALHSDMQSTLARARRDGTTLALLMIDLDNFKPVNDRHGHQVGDQVLREAANRMAALMRGGELHARYGGDEFVAVIEEHGDSASSHHVAERLIRQLSQPITIGNLTLQIGASVGIARFPDDAQNADTWLRQADLALYRAKSGGRGCACYYNPALDNAVAEREAMEQRLRLAIAGGQIVPHYQPVVDLSDRRVRSVELLSRWQDPERGLVPPAEFIDVAERAGLIGELTLAVLRQACIDVKRMPSHWRIAVNVAPEQIQDPTLVDRLMAVLRQGGADPRRFEVELTETALVGDIAAARTTIDALKRHGITVALDDFGTGYSSLSTLSHLSFDKIKIDRGFVATLHERSESVKIVQSIIGLGASLGVQVVAEGVETEREASTLAQLGCGAAQGFLFARPQAIDALLLGHGSPLALTLQVHA